METLNCLDNNQLDELVNIELKSLMLTRQSMSEGAEKFWTEYQGALERNDQELAELLHEKFEACANMSVLCNYVGNLIRGGMPASEAKASTNYYNRINAHLALQAGWFRAAGFSESTIKILTAPFRAQL